MMVTAPFMVPVLLGVKVTTKVQLEFAPTVEPQGVAPPGATAKSPLATALVMLSVTD